ncbi:MAG TPA: copper resistance protein NlpE N-terminal domain-containing protein [Chitinophagaceae bacterium]|nr:copper resistance protein NlpE N-terminal domain-containing protein [Chitinophagaceae bacterium]
MKQAFLYFLGITALLYACNAGTSDSATTVKDTTGIVPDSTDVFDTAYAIAPGDTAMLGFYQGLLPCKNCQGIRYTLLLEDSGRFKLEEFTLGKDIFPGKHEGRWVREGDSLRLIANRKVLAGFLIVKDTLRLAYREGDPITDSIRKEYWIVKAPGASSNPGWKAKRDAGIDFIAIGTEPFWSLELDSGRSISFRPAELPKPLSFQSVQPRITKDSTVYSVSANDATLQVVIYNEFCSDGMSDNIYEHRVHVSYNGQTFKGCGVYLKK